MGAFTVPAAVPVPSGIISGRQVQRQNSWHNGLDLSAPFGTPVYAVSGGTVVAACRDNGGALSSCGSYGQHVVIQHASDLYTLYAHLSAVAVNVGDTVAQHEQIGNVGMTTNLVLADGQPASQVRTPHLHFEVLKRYGTPIGNSVLDRYDVVQMLAAAGVVQQGEGLAVTGVPTVASTRGFAEAQQAARGKGGSGLNVGVISPDVGNAGKWSKWPLYVAIAAAVGVAGIVALLVWRRQSEQRSVARAISRMRPLPRRAGDRVSP